MHPSTKLPAHNLSGAQHLERKLKHLAKVLKVQLACVVGTQALSLRMSKLRRTYRCYTREVDGSVESKRIRRRIYSDTD